MADLSRIQIAPENLSMMPGGLVRPYRALPEERDSLNCCVAMERPLSRDALSCLASETGLRIIPLMALMQDLEEAFDHYYPEDGPGLRAKKVANRVERGMVQRALIGAAVGAVCGYGYHFLMRCAGST